MMEVKICGITRSEDALAVARCGAVAAGFIFYPPSPRFIKPADAKKIIGLLPENLVRVGVFVNQTADEVKSIAKLCGLDMIQLHGDESPDYCRQFQSTMIIKALELKNDDDVQRALNYDVAAILVDSRHAGRYGGTGKISNWELALRLKGHKPLILSGGLSPENVAGALVAVAPDALDINSGVEDAPGKKKHERLTQLFDMIRKSDTTQKTSRSIFIKREP